MADDPGAQKRKRIRWIQRYLVNPPAKVAVWCGLVPGFVLVETTGREAASDATTSSACSRKATPVGWSPSTAGTPAT